MTGSAATDSALRIVLEPGAGFGSGSHETTQLCLQAIPWLRPRGAASWRMLDFGSGSGILSIAAAKLGARVDAVEIDDLALQHSQRNAQRNGVQDQIRSWRSLNEVSGVFDLVIANILLNVLLEYADNLAARLARHGTLAVSGLVPTDTPAVVARYAPLFGHARPALYRRGEWLLLTWTQRDPTAE